MHWLIGHGHLHLRMCLHQRHVQNQWLSRKQLHNTIQMKPRKQKLKRHLKKGGSSFLMPMSPLTKLVHFKMSMNLLQQCSKELHPHYFFMVENMQVFRSFKLKIFFLSAFHLEKGVSMSKEETLCLLWSVSNITCGYHCLT